MSHKIIMPSLGMSQDSGTIVKWKKAVGEYVNAGEEIMEIETDKAIQAIEAPVSGYVKGIFFEENISVPVGEVVAELGEETEATTISSSSHTGTDPEHKKDDSSQIDEFEVVEAPPKNVTLPKHKTDSLTSSSPTPPTPPLSSSKIFASPKAKHHSRQLGISLAKVSKRLNKTVIHYRDLEVYQQTFTLNEQKTFKSEATKRISIMEITIDGSALKRLQEKKINSTSENGNSIEVRHVVGTLALRAWRGVLGDSQNPLSVLIQSSLTKFEDEVLTDADLTSVRELRYQEKNESGSEEDKVDMKIIDLLNTSITSFQSNVEEEMTLTMHYNNQDQLTLKLQSSSDRPYKDNFLFLTTLTDYLQEPILYLR